MMSYTTKVQAISSTFVVTTTADTGPGSLRAAITSSNANATTPSDPNKITFAVAGSGVQTITLASSLPKISQPTVIDGTTQPGSSCGTLVPATLPAQSNIPHQLNIQVTSAVPDGGGTGIFTFYQSADSSQLKGLVVNFAPQATNSTSVYIYAPNVSVTCNYIGTDPTGTTAVSGSKTGGLIVRATASNLLVQNNLISGNTNGNAIYDADSAINPKIYQNLIGTNASATQNLLNTNTANNAGGIDLEAIANADIYKNIIASQGNDIGGGFSGNNSNMKIRGNYLSTDITGMNVLSGGGNSISVGSKGILVGGSTVDDRNVMSGNVRINYVQNTTITGNYIGVASDGQTKLGHGLVYPAYTIHGPFTVGGSQPGEGNVIAEGITEDYDSTSSPCTGNVTVQGNYIGISPNGTNLNVNNNNYGIWVRQCANTVVGGTNPGSGNTIANFYSAGAFLANQSGVGSTGAVVQGNTIKNNYIGIDIENAQQSVISQNTITNNTNGIVVSGSSATTNTITQNSISKNTGEGIQLADSGNNSQPAPYLASNGVNCDGNTIIDPNQNHLQATPNTTYAIEYFSNPSYVSGGTVQGEQYLSSQSVTTDSSGYALLTIPNGTHISATATDPSGNTSSFSTSGVDSFTNCQFPTQATNDPTLSYFEFTGTWNASGFTPSGTSDTGPMEVTNVKVDGQNYDVSDMQYASIDMNGFDFYSSGHLATPLADGTYDVTITFKDTANGLSMTHTFRNALTVDTTPQPTPTVNPLITNNTQPALSGTAPNATNGLGIYLIPPDNTEEYFNIIPNYDLATGTWSLNAASYQNMYYYNFTLGTFAQVTTLPEGTYDVQVSSNGPASSASDATTNELTVDTSAPTGTVTATSTHEDLGRVVLRGTVDDPTAIVKVRVGGANYKAANNADGTWTLPAGTITSITTAGTYPVTVSFTDAATNQTQATSSLSVDVPPTVNSTTWVGGRPILHGRFDHVNALSFRVLLAGRYYTLGSSPELTAVGDIWTLDLSHLAEPLAVGKYTATAEVETLSGQILQNTSTQQLTIKPITPISVIILPSNGPLAETGMNMYKYEFIAVGLVLIGSVTIVGFFVRSRIMARR